MTTVSAEQLRNWLESFKTLRDVLDNTERSNIDDELRIVLPRAVDMSALLVGLDERIRELQQLVDDAERSTTRH